MKRCVFSGVLFGIAAFLGASHDAAAADGALTDYASHSCSGRTCTFASASGQSLRLTAYGEHMIRVQVLTAGQAPFADDRYPFVKSHALGGTLSATDQGSSIKVSTGKTDLLVDKASLRLHMVDASGQPLIEENGVKRTNTADRPVVLTVNGSPPKPTLSFPFTGWSTWQTVSVPTALPAGTSLIRLTAAGASGPNLDSLKVNGVTYEAENATRSGVNVSTQYPGFTGAGYGDFQNLNADFIEFSVTVPAAGNYNLDFVYANGAAPSLAFSAAPGEHFMGLGHGTFGRVDKIDLRGGAISHNRALQSSLIVPFMISSKGYGLFVNSPYASTFTLTDTETTIGLFGGQLDYFLIAGPSPAEILDHYTELTGRPRLPPLSSFGASWSDKIGDDLPSDEAWWKANVTRLRNEGYPIDVIVHDNAWRGGKTASWRWDNTRYPNPAEFQTWCVQNGVVNQLDFNRADAPLSAGWQPSFALPGTTDFPDFSTAGTRSWFWNLMRTESLDPAKGYPGDSLWLDEFDEVVTPTNKLANGWTWDEAANLYFFWMAQAVGEGWDKTFGASKRPYIMARGMTAGAQRWSSLWTGDIQNTYDEMKQQIRGMLAAGVSGFPFEAHDAGGFFNKPSNAMYRQWSLAMGSFSPMWKPHGPPLRFPWLFGPAAQEDARKYGALRMALMPYLYTYAAIAEENGSPVARAMAFEYPNEAEAWTRDLQYLWGHEILVAPATSDGGSVSVWFPPGVWYDFWDDTRIEGGARDVAAPTGRLPLFVRAGAIVPQALPTLGTASWDRKTRVVDVWAGAPGTFLLHEDDGITEGHLAGQRSKTSITFTETPNLKLEIGPEDGVYSGIPATRQYRARFHALTGDITLYANGKTLDVATSADDAIQKGGRYWDATKKVLLVVVLESPRDKKLVISTNPADGIPDDGGSTIDNGSEDGTGSSTGCSCRTIPHSNLTPWGALAALALIAERFRRRHRA